MPLQACCIMFSFSSFSAAWDGSSVWDLPIDSMAQAPTIEQMQQMEKAKSAKVNLISEVMSDGSLCFLLFQQFFKIRL